MLTLLTLSWEHALDAQSLCCDALRLTNSGEMGDRSAVRANSISQWIQAGKDRRADKDEAISAHPSERAREGAP